jgi:ribosomal protein S18 acetylase RimI-like enzyme
MITKIDSQIRQITNEDKGRLANLLHFELHVHRNLDWKSPLDWIGDEPFLAIEQENIIMAAMACPPDPPEIAWIRLFAAHAKISTTDAWDKLWESSKSMLKENPEVNLAAAIAMHGWFRNLLKKHGFEHFHDVIMLSWAGGKIPPKKRIPEIIIRPMNYDDLPATELIDRAAFKPIWRNSLEVLRIAFKQASLATVAEFEGNLIGYQISTANSFGGHLARLAVKPEFQGKGIGHTLVCDSLFHFQSKGANQVTVNTQSDNQASLKLYKNMGFVSTGEIYPVFQYRIT